jgi:hypothetical protein
MHPAFSYPRDSLGAELPSMTVADGLGQGNQPVPTKRVGRERLRLIAKRARFIARFIYWTWRHRSTKHVLWVLAHEGTEW